MVFGTFTLVIDGERLDGTPENKARLHLTAQGPGILRDDDGDEFKFPAQFAKSDGVSISLPYDLTLFTDSIDGNSTTIGYEGYVRTDYGRVTFQFAAPENGSTVQLVDLTDDVVTPISDLQVFRDEAEAAALAAEASAESFETEKRKQQIRPLEAALARRDVDLLVIGDSISEGTGPTLVEKRYPSRLRDSLRAQLSLPSGGRGYVPANYAITPAQSDELWVASGGAIDANSLARGLGKRGYRLNAAGHKVTLTVPVGHTDVDLFITGKTGDTSIYTPTVDGVVGSNVNVQTLASATERDVVISAATGLNPSITHTIEITWASGNVWVSGAMLYAAGEKAGGVNSGVRLWDGSHHGKGSDWFANPAEAWNYTINTIQPDAVIISLGRNNWSAGDRTPVQVRADIEALIVSVMTQTTVDPAIIIMPVYGTLAGGTPVAPWSAYIAEQRDLAVDNGYGFVDLSERLGTITNTATNALGITSTDFVHPSDTGSQMIAGVLAGYINTRAPQPNVPTNLAPDSVTLNAAAGVQKVVTFATNGISRWLLRSNSTAESGANAGSDFELVSRDDSGNILKTVFQIFRSNGRITLGDGIDLAAGTTTGTRIGTGTTQKLAFFGSPAIVKPTALTAPDATTVDATYGTEEAAVINNLRTRVNELETKLKALGLLT